MVVSMGYFSACCGIVFEDYSRGGSSRSIPLTDAERGRLRHVAADLLALLPQVGGILLMVGRLPNSGIKVFASPL